MSLCLGWKNKDKCRTPLTVGEGNTLADACAETPTWFWLVLGAIGIGAVAKKK
jgi:hypothetical protein